MSRFILLCAISPAAASRTSGTAAPAVLALFRVSAVMGRVAELGSEQASPPDAGSTSRARPAGRQGKVCDPDAPLSRHMPVPGVGRRDRLSHDRGYFAADRPRRFSSWRSRACRGSDPRHPDARIAHFPGVMHPPGVPHPAAARRCPLDLFLVSVAIATLVFRTCRGCSSGVPPSLPFIPDGGIQGRRKS
jgi:hypothetical protein